MVKRHSRKPRPGLWPLQIFLAISIPLVGWILLELWRLAEVLG